MAKRRIKSGPRRRRIDDLAARDEEFLTEVAGESESEWAEEGEGAKQESHEDARTFGESGKAWMVVELSEDNQQATLKALSFGGEKIKGQEVVDAIRDQYQIRHGFDKEAIKEAIAKARKDDVARGAFVIAKGTPGVAGEDGVISLKFMPESEGQGNIGYQALKDSLSREELDAVLESELPSALVAPGELLAVVTDPTEGEPQKDVLGNAVTQPGAEADLKAGENVEATADGFVAKAYGYTCLLDSRISVLSPIWVSGDLQRAHFIHFPQVRAEVQAQSHWLLQALQLKGVTSGIDEVAIEKLCEEAPAATEKCSVLVAGGKAPVDGQDTYVKYRFEAEQRVGKILPDGSIDFKDRNTASGVFADQLLGEMIPATKGEPGTNLQGEEVAARDGEEKTFTAGQNVRTQTEKDVVQFYSEIEGAINIAGETIEVQPIYSVSGDVDFESGNVDLPMNVEIAGSVRSGFTVKSGGSVVIGGIVENGANIHAEGDVIAANGILGHDTKVVALGSVETKFIQNSTVMAVENVTVGAYIMNATVRAGGEVKVEEGGGGRGGSIIGGEVIASKRIQAKLIGSADTDRTVVGVGPNAEQLKRQRELHQLMRIADAQIPDLVKRLGIPKADIDHIEALLERTPEKRREEIEEPAAKLKALVHSRELAHNSQEELAEQIASCVSKGRISASETVYEDVQVQFGSDTIRIGNAVKGVEFRLGAEGIRWRPLDSSEAGGVP